MRRATKLAGFFGTTREVILNQVLDDFQKTVLEDGTGMDEVQKEGILEEVRRLRKVEFVVRHEGVAVGSEGSRPACLTL